MIAASIIFAWAADNGLWHPAFTAVILIPAQVSVDLMCHPMRANHHKSQPPQQQQRQRPQQPKEIPHPSPQLQPPKGQPQLWPQKLVFAVVEMRTRILLIPTTAPSTLCAFHQFP